MLIKRQKALLQPAKTHAEQNTLLDPRIYDPITARFFRSPHQPVIQQLLELIKSLPSLWNFEELSGAKR